VSSRNHEDSTSNNLTQQSEQHVGAELVLSPILHHPQKPHPFFRTRVIPAAHALPSVVAAAVPDLLNHPVVIPTTFCIRRKQSSTVTTVNYQQSNYNNNKFSQQMHTTSTTSSHSSAKSSSSSSNSSSSRLHLCRSIRFALVHLLSLFVHRHCPLPYSSALHAPQNGNNEINDNAVNVNIINFNNIHHNSSIKRVNAKAPNASTAVITRNDLRKQCTQPDVSAFDHLNYQQQQVDEKAKAPTTAVLYINSKVRGRKSFQPNLNWKKGLQVVSSGKCEGVATAPPASKAGRKNEL
jgi:hypothetical protein